MAEQKLPNKAQENEMKREKVRVVPIKYIDDSPDHPFQVRDDEEMMSLVESIATFGVITPVIARKTADERYELISGHRRKRACELLHIDTLPIIVRDLSREEGIILMVDSNLQREHILPSEKAFAYKMKLEAMKKTAGRPSKNNYSPMGNNLGELSSEKLAEEIGESKNQIFRYIRLVVGGSGAGKTRFYCKPNLMQCNTSFVILDPKGEILRDTGYLLREKGYDVRILDLINMEKSDCYNPFRYINSENDVQRLVTNLFKSTTPKGSSTQDPFWDNAASMLLSALIYYLHYEAPEYEQNFSMVIEMLREGDVDEDNDKHDSVLDTLFGDLEKRDPYHIAVKYYNEYRSGSGKTLKSIQITLAARLEKFNLESLASITVTDELQMDTIGKKKTALFALIPDNDTSFNFLVSILYTQLFQQLFYVADHEYGGCLPVPVHFLMDEFANETQL